MRGWGRPPEVTRPYGWDELARATLRRQFPAVRGHGPDAVVDLVDRVGPVQSQVARSPFVAASSRLPGVGHDAVVQAYESHRLLRGTSVRGTVHTGTVAQHELLDAVSRPTLAAWWQRGLGLTPDQAVAVRASVEAFATGAWRTPDELRGHLADRLRALGHPQADELDSFARGLAHGHGALVRRPATGAAWDRQTAPVYRQAAELLGRPRDAVVADPGAALVELVRCHVRWFGPSSRRDVAWFTGDRLTDVDAAVAALGEELVGRAGPDGETYLDLAEGVPDGDPDPGTRLLPEFDGLLMGRDSKRRQRFVDDAHLPWYWTRGNGLFASVLLHDGRLRGSWRFDGSGRRRAVDVRVFPGEPLVAEADLADQVRALEAVLMIEVHDVRVTRAG